MFRVLLVVTLDVVPGGLLGSVALVGKAGVDQFLYLGLVGCEGIKSFTLTPVPAIAFDLISFVASISVIFDIITFFNVLVSQITSMKSIIGII